MAKDRRRFRRHPCRLRVRFSSPRQLKEQYITNIGAGGIFVETLYPLEIGTPVDLELLIGEAHLPLSIRGEVVWIRNRSDAGPSGMGIQFREMASQVRDELERFMQCLPSEPEA